MQHTYNRSGCLTQKTNGDGATTHSFGELTFKIIDFV